MPPLPFRAFTISHAIRRISFRYILSYSAWNLRVALRLAARHNVLWNSRAFSMGLLASGIPSLLPPLNTRAKQGSFPPMRLCCPHPHRYTMSPSDSPARHPFPLHRFTAYRSGYIWRPHLTWWGLPSSQTQLSPHSAPLTPESSSALPLQGLHAFFRLHTFLPVSAPSCPFRGNHYDAAGFTLCCGLQGCNDTASTLGLLLTSGGCYRAA